MSVINDRLKLAGINLEINPNHPTLASVIPPYAIFANRARRLGSFIDAGDSIKALNKAAGGPIGLQSLLASVHRVSPELSATDLIMGAMKVDRNHIAMGRVLRLEGLRSSFMECAQNSNNSTCFEGCFGLIGIGINEDEASQLIEFYKQSSESDNQAALIATVLRSSHLMNLVQQGALDEEVDDSSMLSALVATYEEQSLEPFIEFINDSDSSYTLRICYYFMLGHLAEQFATIDNLQAMLEIYSEEDDSDSLVMAMYALGQFVKVLGFDAAKQVLEAARDDYGDGSGKQSLLINAAYRATPNGDETQELIEVLNSFDDDDSDLKRSLGRARNSFTGANLDASHWLLSGGYGRGYDLYDPFASEPGGYVPEAVRSIFFTPTPQGVNLFVSLMKRLSIRKEFFSLIISRCLEIMPKTMPLFTKLLNTMENESCLPGFAVALLTSSTEHNEAPLLLRCLTADEDFGGPAPDTPEALGILLGCLTFSATRSVAKKLLVKLSEPSRKACIAYLQSSVKNGDINDNHYKLLFELGATLQTPPVIQADLKAKLAFGESVSADELLVYMQDAQDTSDETWAMVIDAFIDYDRSDRLSLASNSSLWREAPLKLVQSTIINLRQGSWGKRELSCVLIASIGLPILENNMESTIHNHIDLCVNDDDSDVRREAKKAAKAINYTPLIINAETITDGILNPASGPEGQAEQAKWVDRLFEFLKKGDDRSEILDMCKNDAIWKQLDPTRLGKEWMAVTRKGWVARETMCVLATHYVDLLLVPNGNQIRDRLIDLCEDDDSDVANAATTACDTHGFDH